jgi:hypothetical protein
MYSIINFHTWLQIIDELFTLDGTYPKSLQLWRAVLESLKAENDLRARLAHYAISQDEEKIGDEGTGTQAYLRPARLDLRTKSKKAKPLTMVEISDFTGRVGQIHERPHRALAANGEGEILALKAVDEGLAPVL